MGRSPVRNGVRPGLYRRDRPAIRRDRAAGRRDQLHAQRVRPDRAGGDGAAHAVRGLGSGHAARSPERLHGGPGDRYPHRAPGPGRSAFRAGDMGTCPADGDPVEMLRDRAAELLCASYGYGGPESFVAVGGLPVQAGLVTCTGAVEIAVHGWDVSAARSRAARSRRGRLAAGLARSRRRSPPGCSGWARCSWRAARACSPCRSRSRHGPARATGWSATSAATPGDAPLVTGE